MFQASSRSRFRLTLTACVLLGLLAACNTSAAPPAPPAQPTDLPTATTLPPTSTLKPTDQPTATPLPPTATPSQTPKPTNTPVPPTDTPEPTATAQPTNTPKPAPTKVVTPKPTATKKVEQPPLQAAVIRARDSIESIGGAMDRIYHGGGGEACAPFMASYAAVVNSPTYDVSAQPANVQGAYALYRQGVDFVPASKISQIAKICMDGGGSIGALDFNEARQAVNTAGGLFAQALSSLGQ